MRPRTTLILLVLTVALGAWMMLREKDGPRDLGGHLLFDYNASVLEGDADTLRVEVNAAEVSGIDLRSSAVEISLRREQGVWEMTKGVVDRADAKFVEQLLAYCSTARITDSIDAEEIADGKASAAELGLDDANAWHITWRKADGTALAEITVGKTTPLDNAGYVQVAGVKRRPDIYLIKPDLRPLLARPLDSFRDPRGSRYNEEEVQRLVVRKGEGEVELSRAPGSGAEPGPWVISRPLLNAPADQKAAKDFASVICGLKVKGWLPWTEPADKPIVEVTLYPQGEGAKGSTLSFFPDADAKDMALCRDAQRKACFKVDQEIVDYLCIADSPNPFRSRQLATVNAAIISTVEVRTPGESVTVVRVGNKWSWRPLAGGAWSDAEPGRLEKLITLVNEAEIVDFASDALTDPAAFALDKPDYAITFAAGAHLSLDQLTQMTDKNSQTLRIAIRQDGHIFANFSGDPYVYRVGPEVTSGIPQSAIKWRSLTLPGFGLPQVRAVKQSIGTDPPVELKHDPLSFKWSATRGGEDVTALLLPAAAESLAARLGSLSVAAWLEQPAEALKALEKPAVSLEVVYESYGEKAADVQLVTVILTLAPTATGGSNAPLCYGRLTGVAEPFLIDSRLMKEMRANLLPVK